MTRRNLALAEDGEISRTGASSYLLSFGTTPPEQLFAEFQLLRSGLATRLTFRHPHDRQRVVLRMADHDGRASASITADTLELDVGPRELDGWAFFVLEGYRDGATAVDHIDVEAVEERSGAVIDVVLRFPAYYTTP